MSNQLERKLGCADTAWIKHLTVLPDYVTLTSSQGGTVYDKKLRHISPAILLSFEMIRKSIHVPRARPATRAKLPVKSTQFPGIES